MNTPSDTGYDGKTPITVTAAGGRPSTARRTSPSGPTGDLYVSDGYGNCRVHRFSPTAS